MSHIVTRTTDDNGHTTTVTELFPNPIVDVLTEAEFDAIIAFHSAIEVLPSPLHLINTDDYDFGGAA